MPFGIQENRVRKYHADGRPTMGFSCRTVAAKVTQISRSRGQSSDDDDFHVARHRSNVNDPVERFSALLFFLFIWLLFFASPRNETTIDNLLVKRARHGVVVSRRRTAGGKERLTDDNRVIGCYGVFRMFR